MMSTLLLLSASLVANPVVISEVKATRESGHLRIDVVGDAGIDPEGARTKLDGGVLVIYLPGTRVREDNRAWDLADGQGEIRAHRHRTETELVVPLAGNGCSGPVELTGSETGISALVGCDGVVAAPTRTVAVKAARTADENQAPAKVSEITIPKISMKQAARDQQLKALVELPKVDDDETIPAAKTVAPAAKATPVVAAAAVPAAAAPVMEAPAPAPAPRLRVEAATAEVVPVLAAPKAAEMPGSSTSTSTSAGGSPGAGSTSAWRAVALPGLLLAGLAVAAFVFARRRRGTVLRHIEILETTTLGPKRSLVVARVGGETLLLGSSEAGITLLTTRPGSAAADFADSIGAHRPARNLPEALARSSSLSSAAPSAPSAASTAASAAASASPEDFEIETSQPIEEALADIPEPDFGRGTGSRGAFRAIEGGLAGLLRSRVGGGSDRSAGGDDSAESFDDLLEDSLEDQELRRKLAAGMSARAR